MAARDPLQTETRSPARSVGEEKSSPIPALTVLCHPDGHRVGERALLTDFLGGKAVELSRLFPLFAAARGGTPRPLEDAYLSRNPFRLHPKGAGGVLLETGHTSTQLVVDGKPVASERLFSKGDLDRGAVLSLADRIVLVLHLADLTLPVSPASALIGQSRAINRARTEIAQIADLDIPVLIRGPSGTGKELVARAVHDVGPRRDKPFLALNVGALPKDLAGAELFGAVKGAFTGADRTRPGYFQRAEGGTLFLDEIGSAPPEIQAMLLRVLETGEIQPVGGMPVAVEARVVSATDSDLESAVDEGDFRSPLLHRLSAYEIFLPPLNARREDFGLLFFHFLRQELMKMGELDRLQAADDQEPWVPAGLVACLALHPWPGNVRQLKNVARQIAVASRGLDALKIPPRVRQMTAEVARDPGPKASQPRPLSQPQMQARDYRPPGEVSEEELLAALQAENFYVERAAQRLRLSKTTLYRLMDRSSLIRKASDLKASEIRTALQEANGDVGSAAYALGVSPKGLREQMRKLGILP